ncbi:Cytochrome P450 2D3 [Hypsibius exemplaris]|uniref:Cytochrome P450 2D3 n=1 Tax=Hypsibius exemplaris TaxID=2072580 RepID=A0A1W0XF28_HYPEX|nr:Cytochrome P450 2D3 [Hypsibius exemplaris]
MLEFLAEFTVLKTVASLFLAGPALLWIYFPAYFRRIWERFTGRIPPGPLAFPILGNIDVDRQHPELTFRKWATQYGRVFSFFLGDRFCIGLADMKLMRKVLKDDRFSGRANAGIFAHLEEDLTKGIAFSNGELWKEHRTFSISALRDSGNGKSDSSVYVEKETANLLAAMNSMNGTPFDPKHLFIGAAANVLSSLLWSGTFQPDDSSFNGFVSNIEKNLQEFANAVMMEVYPWLRKIYPFTNKFRRLNTRVGKAMGFLKNVVQEHKKTFDPAHPRDYCDAFFAIQRNQAKKAECDQTFTDLQLVRNLADIYITGYETTATFLRWCMVYIILHQDVQERVQDEIDAVVGKFRYPTPEDEQNMPYTKAVITEIHRISSFVPFAVPHCTTEDVELEGFAIPKGTEVWPVVCHHFMNSEIWGDPETFRPERFLDAAGVLIPGLVQEVQPYGVGRRACVGEPLAKAEIFSFFTSILQKFTIISPTAPSLVPVVTQVLAPAPFTMVARRRN